MMKVSRRSLILGAGAGLITRPALAFPVQLRDPLKFPVGIRPVFNPAHPAAGTVNFSGVSLQGGGVINLVTGKAGVKTGTYPGSIDGRIGPVTTAAASAYFTFSSAVPSQTDTQATFAGIVLNPPNSGILPLSVGSTNGPDVYFSGADVIQFNIWGGSAAGGLQYTIYGTGTPIFFAMSMNGTKVVQVLTNLATGQITTASNSSTSFNAHDGTVIWGAGNNLGLQFTYGIAAQMYSTQFLSLPQLVEWAQAPWDFWYPPAVSNLIMSELAKPSSSAAVLHNRTLMGVGQ